jgi:hypothetical protein
MRKASLSIFLLFWLCFGCAGPRSIPPSTHPDQGPDREPASLPDAGATSSNEEHLPADAASDNNVIVGPTEDEKVADWHKKLPSGLIEYAISPTMRIGEPKNVSVTLHGEKAPSFIPAPGSLANPLQMSPWMVVKLTSIKDPDGFTIDPSTVQPARLIASDGVTTWNWTVTPLKTGLMELHVEADVLYLGDEKNAVSYDSYDGQINVSSVSVAGEVKSGWQWIQLHPAESLKYILPGGAGAAILVKLVGWLLAWRKRRKTNRPH